MKTMPLEDLVDVCSSFVTTRQLASGRYQVRVRGTGARLVWNGTEATLRAKLAGVLIGEAVLTATSHREPS
jgi:hypothetical protein